MPQTHCADPFKKHKTKCHKGLWKVSQKLIDDVDDPRLKDGDFLCISCKIPLIKNPKSLPQQDQIQDSSSSSADQDSQSSIQENISEPAMDTSLSDAEVSREVTEAVLPLIGVSPLSSSE